MSVRTMLASFRRALGRIGGAMSVILTLWIGSAYAQSITVNDPGYQAARTALIEGRYDAALPGMTRAANAGLSQAQYNLGLIYLNGYGVTPNEAQARRWFEQACAQDLPQCYTTLGEMYRMGRGGETRYADAIALFEKAARLNNPSGFFQLGVVHDKGYGVPVDHAKALDYFKKAAALGHKMAGYNAGQMLLIGDDGVAPDHDAAIPLLMNTAAQGDVASLNTLGFVYRSGFTGPVNLPRARDYFLRAEAKGSASASRLLSTFTADATTDAFNIQAEGRHRNAYYAMEDLCEMDVDRACLEYGRYMIYGADDLPARNADAISVLQPLCEKRHPNACEGLYLAVLKTGRPAGQSLIRKAASHYQAQCHAAEKVYSACYNLAYMYYYDGFGMSNWQEAKSLSVDACFNGGEKGACPMAYHIMNTENRAAGTPRSSGGLGASIGDFLTGLGQGIAAASASGYDYSSRTYSSATSRSSTPLQTQNTRQDWINWQNRLQATQNIGTGFNSTCPTTNPYC